MLLEGSVKNITFRNPQNGYSVLKVIVAGKKTPVTFTGITPDIAEGERVSVTGEWTEHPKYGKQFSMTSCEVLAPDTNEAMIRYLAGPQFPGIGIKMAEQIVAKFGDNLASVIEKEPNRFLEIKGFNPAKLLKFIGCWETAHDTREVTLFLYENEITGSTAKELVKTFGKATASLIKENPYMLCDPRFEVTFPKADAIAKRLGFRADADERIEAALCYALVEGTLFGHVYLPCDVLFDKAFRLLGFTFNDEDILYKANNALAKLIQEEKLIQETENGKIPGIWLPKLHKAETSIAKFVKERSNRQKTKLSPHALEELARFEEKQGFPFDESQKQGILEAMQNKFTVLTGGPGTGKTTMLRGILHLAALQKEKTLLAAPTGRAAKRMKEVCKREALTIHRLLAVDPVTGAFTKNNDNPVSAALLIIDEFSMVDTELCAALFEAIPWSCRVLLVGDADQLPSVGPGNILRELLESSKVPQIRLQRIFRQLGENDIAEKADAINHGHLPAPIEGRNFHFIPYNTIEQGEALLFDTISKVVPSTMKLDIMQDLQILVPMRKGPFGTIELNKQLQKFLNPQGTGITLAGNTWKVGDRVMQLQNNYEKNIFNGDIGFITNISSDGKSFDADFDDRILNFTSEDINELALAYATTVHKAQGSEYSAVIMVLDTSHSRMLRRNLLYTAVTRAKGHVWILAAPGALDTAIRNQSDTRRYTKLKARIENKPSEK